MYLSCFIFVFLFIISFTTFFLGLNLGPTRCKARPQQLPGKAQASSPPRLGPDLVRLAYRAAQWPGPLRPFPRGPFPPRPTSAPACRANMAPSLAFCFPSCMAYVECTSSPFCFFIFLIFPCPFPRQVTCPWPFFFPRGPPLLACLALPFPPHMKMAIVCLALPAQDGVLKTREQAMPCRLDRRSPPAKPHLTFHHPRG